MEKTILNLRSAFGLLLLGFILFFLLSSCATGARKSKLNVPDEAPQEKTTAADVEPGLKTIYGMARLLKAQGKLEQSEIVLQRILAENPSFFAANIDLAEIYMREGHIDLAFRELKNAQQYAPDNPVLLNNIGICNLFLGDYAEAKKSFELASEKAPRETRYRSNQALALGLIGDEEASLAIYNEFLTTEDALHNLSTIQEIRENKGSIQEVVSSGESPDSYSNIPEMQLGDS